MPSAARREEVKKIIRQADAPVSASRLAELLGVSRQIIVGDVALLRAQGCDIIATSRGYIIAPRPTAGRYLGKVACQHTAAGTVEELYAIVDLGAAVVDVIVEHELYGEITGQLNLHNRAEVDAFTQKASTSKDKLLSELTKGVHLHTVACRDMEHYEQVRGVLRQRGFLYESN